MPGSDIACGAARTAQTSLSEVGGSIPFQDLRFCFAMSGTDICSVAPRWCVLSRFGSGTVLRVVLRNLHAMSTSDKGSATSRPAKGMLVLDPRVGREGEVRYLPTHLERIPSTDLADVATMPSNYVLSSCMQVLRWYATPSADLP